MKRLAAPMCGALRSVFMHTTVYIIQVKNCNQTHTQCVPKQRMTNIQSSAQPVLFLSPCAVEFFRPTNQQRRLHVFQKLRVQLVRQHSKRAEGLAGCSSYGALCALRLSMLCIVAFFLQLFAIHIVATPAM